MSENRHLPDTYLTDGRTLFYVIERLDTTTVLVENAATGEEIKMGDADLVGYRLVDNKGQNDDEQPQGSR